MSNCDCAICAWEPDVRQSSRVARSIPSANQSAVCPAPTASAPSTNTALSAEPKGPGDRLRKTCNESAASPTNASPATITSCIGTANGYKFMPSLGARVSPKSKYKFTRVSTAVSRPFAAPPGLRIKTLHQVDIFTLPLG